MTVSPSEFWSVSCGTGSSSAARRTKRSHYSSWRSDFDSILLLLWNVTECFWPHITLLQGLSGGTERKRLLYALLELSFCHIFGPILTRRSNLGEEKRALKCLSLIPLPNPV